MTLPRLALVALLILILAALAWILRGGGESPPERATAIAPPAAPPTEEPEHRDTVELTLEGPATGSQLVTEPEAPPAPAPTYELHGRVRDASTQRGLARIVVQLSGPELATLETHTDEDGRFHLASPGPETPCELNALPPAGWARSRAVRPGPSQLTGEEEIPIALSREESRPVSGRVVDANTGEPVPDLLLNLEGQVGRELGVPTDQGGAFESRGAFASGALAIAVSDPAPEGEHLLGSFAIDWGPQAADASGLLLEVEIGPTFHFQFPAYTGTIFPAEWQVTLKAREIRQRISGLLDVSSRHIRALTEEDLQAYVRRIEFLARRQGAALAIAPQPPTGEGLGDRLVEGLTLSAILRPGPFPWVRFPQPLGAIDPTLLMLELESRGGGWFAELDIESTAGVHPAILLPQPEARGRVNLIVKCVDCCLPEGCSGLLIERDPAPGQESRHYRSDVQGASLFFESIPVGAYRLIVENPLEVPHERTIDVFQGPNGYLPVLFSGNTDDGVISGKLITREGRGQDFALIHLRGADGLPVSRSVLAGSNPEGTGEDDFLFENLPRGKYELTAQPLFGVPWVPEQLVSFTPASNLIFELTEPGELATYAWDVRDPDRDRSIPWFDVRFGDRGWVQGGDEDLGRRTGLELPKELELEWMVYAGGYQPVWGTEADFVEDAQGVRRATVELRRGWGANLHFRELVGEPTFDWLSHDPDARAAFHAAPPIEGVEVGLVPWMVSLYSTVELAQLEEMMDFLLGSASSRDPIPVGLSDEGGRLRLALDEEPNVLSLHRPGWHLKGTSYLVEPDRGAPPDAVVWMSREVSED